MYNRRALRVCIRIKIFVVSMPEFEEKKESELQQAVENSKSWQASRCLESGRKVDKFIFISINKS